MTKSQFSLTSALTTTAQKPDTRLQSSLHVSLPLPARDSETRDDETSTGGGVGSHKSESCSNGVIGDKTTKENK